MWLELEHTTHTDAFLQSAAVRQLSLGIGYGFVFLLHFSLRLRKWVPPPFLWSWCYGWVGWGTKKIDQFLKEGSSLVLAVALKLLHRKLLVLGRTARRGGVYRFRPRVATIPLFFVLWWGSMPLLVRDLAS